MDTILYIYYSVCCFLLIIYKTMFSNSYVKTMKNLFISNNVTVCLFLPSARDDFSFVQGIISSIDEFWPIGIGKKIHWIDNYQGEINFIYKTNWTIIRDCTPNIRIPVMKQQYNSYISYKYCKGDEYIAMFDSDSALISYVQYNMLFDTSKRPYVLYTLKFRDSRWDPRKVLKSNNDNWGDVMFTYPIIFKTEHLEELNRYMEDIHNSTLVNLLNEYIFGQFGTFLEYIHIKKYENQYALINVEESPFPPRCSIHIPYSYVEVNWRRRQRVMVAKHRNIKLMNKLIYYLIEQGKCAEDRKTCREFNEKKYIMNTHTIEARYKHYYLYDNFSFNNKIYNK